MPRVRAAVLLLAWMARTLGGVAWGGAGEQRWTQYWGQVHSITIDRCGQRPGVCEGTLVLTPRRGREVSLAMRPGMWLTRGDRLVRLEELRVGDQIHVQAFEVAGAGAEQAAQSRSRGSRAISHGCCQRLRRLGYLRRAVSTHPSDSRL